MGNPIVKLERAAQYLAESEDLAEIKQIHDIAIAADHYARAQQLGIEAENRALAIRLRAGRRLGELVPAETSGPGRGRKSVREADGLLVPRQRLSEFRKLADIEEVEFEKRIARAQDKQERLSLNKLVSGPIIPDSTGNEWYTPEKYIASVRAVLGTIDLDPATSEQANETIRANTIYTKDDDGLSKPWFGRIFMNPPYSMNKPFAQKMSETWDSGEIDEAIVLLGAHAIETGWFSWYWDHVLCFTGHRIKFDTPDGPAVAGNIAGSVFVYLGPNQLKFAEEFGQHGYVVKRWPE